MYIFNAEKCLAETLPCNIGGSETILTNTALDRHRFDHFVRRLGEN